MADYPDISLAHRVWVVLQQKCPRCLSGAIFSDAWEIFEACPNCGLMYEREPGYFTGAMYLSYGMAGLICIPLWVWLVTLGLPTYATLLIVAAALAIATPLVFRYSRIVWLHLDQIIAPR
ncbi:MAG: DUF983 domain-containing protein [Chloroflexota bacterium]